MCNDDGVFGCMTLLGCEDYCPKDLPPPDPDRVPAAQNGADPMMVRQEIKKVTYD